MKNIIILNGSPRSGGNTELLARAFAEGATEAGHSVEQFDLGKLSIAPCLGCLQGGQDKLSPCVQKDDMDKIYPVYEAADLFVFASPMYYWSFSAQFKTAFDRLFAVMEASGYQNPPKECVLLMAAEEDSAENFAPIAAYYESLLQHLGWTDKGRVLAGGVMNIGDIAGKPALEEARQLGASLA